MNIQEAKNELKNCITAYLSKDEYNNYIIPIEQQRPIYLYGASGIGKTAIVYQVAEEKNIGFVSYSMTHHTRQTAIGLPFITENEYNGNNYKVTLYTLSEIINSIYETNKKEGILFIDEINCISESLLPILLQFLQYKKFGNHILPNGWIIITAGNPPEYNQSAFEFEIALLDRLKLIEVEPSFPIWKEYAIANNIYPTIISFLETHSDYFYNISSKNDKNYYVTPRGWTDLSKIIYVYELNKIEITYNLVIQYIHYPIIANEFVSYYNIINKVIDDNLINILLNNNNNNNNIEKLKFVLKTIKPNEYITLIYCLKNKLENKIIEYNISQSILNILNDFIKLNKDLIVKLYNNNSNDLIQYIYKLLEKQFNSDIVNNNISILEFKKIIKNYILDSNSIKDCKNIENNSVILLEKFISYYKNNYVNNLFNTCVQYNNNIFNNIKFIYGNDSNELKTITVLFTKTKNIILFASKNFKDCIIPKT